MTDISKTTTDSETRLREQQAEIEKLRARVAELERLDAEAAAYVESVICLRTAFTGNPPYVGWKGLGLALTETLDQLDALRAEVLELREAQRAEIRAARRMPRI